MIAPYYPMENKILEELKKQYKEGIPGKIQKIESLIQSFNQSWTKDSLKALRIEIHKLAGNAGTYGYLDVSVLCKKLDQELMPYIETLGSEHKNQPPFNSLGDFLKQLKEMFN